MNSPATGQTPTASWQHFPNQRRLQVLYLLPYIWETKGFSGTENPHLSNILSSLEKFHEFLVQGFDIEVCWIETGNHLTREYLDPTSFKITPVSMDRTKDLFLNREVDLIVACGWEVLDLVHNDKIPTILYSGFLPSPLNSARSMKYQKILFTTPGQVDFFITQDPAELEFFEKYQEILGIKKLQASLLTTQKNSTVSASLAKNKEFQQFLQEPEVTPKSQSLISKLDDSYRKNLDEVRNDLVEQRESELLWMRKAFTQEIEKLIADIEGLRKRADGLEREGGAQLKGQLSVLQEQKTQLEAQEKSALEKISQLQTALEEKPQEVPGSTVQVEELNRTIHDLQMRLQRYRSQIPFVMMQWAYDFVITYLVRLPLAVMLLGYHIGSSLLHRYLMSRRPS
jgi:hypothetical protein